jgi:hypothetical protein
MIPQYLWGVILLYLVELYRVKIPSRIDTMYICTYQSHRKAKDIYDTLGNMNYELRALQHLSVY